MKNPYKSSRAWQYIEIAFGTFLMAAALVFFLEPNTIAPGGVTGLAIIIKQSTGIPIDITNLVINIPLFVAGLIILGKMFGAKTAFGTLSLSLFLRLIYTVVGENNLFTDDLLLAAIYGGVILGIGIGLVFRAGGTTGGTDLAGAILNKYFPNISIAKMMTLLDFLIVVLAGVVSMKVETSLYSTISLYIIVKLADFMVDGLSYSKAFFIISNNTEEIGKEIIAQLGRGGTILKAAGMYTGQEKNVILCIVSRNQVLKLKSIVYDIDNTAFIMVTTIHEVLGEGFSEVEN